MLSTTATAANLLTRMAQAWDRFWFTPANPTTLGVMRLFVGILTLYIHLAYTTDLYEFFGPDGWMSLQRINEQRRDTPWLGPTQRWVGIIPSIYLPPDRDDRERVLNFIQENLETERQRQQMLAWIRQPDLAPAGTLPGWLRNMTAEAAAPDQVAPWELPPPPSRAMVLQFIEGLPSDKATRDDILDYMKRYGVDPRQLFWRGTYLWSVWFHVTDPTWMAVTHGAILGIMLLFTVGFCTRITAVLTWLAALSYIQRSSITLFGGDTMMNVLLLYLMIAPSGAALSVDRLLARWWEVRQARRQGLPPPAWLPPQPSVSANFVLRLLMVHFCIMYFAAGTSKLLGGYWWNGHALYYTMANYEFAPLSSPLYQNWLRWLCQHRLLWEIVMSAGTYYTLALEISLPYLVWNPRLRPLMVGGSMLLHVSIAIFMGLTVFSLLMATWVMAFLPGDTMQQMLGWLRRRLGQEDTSPAAEVAETPGATDEPTPTDAEPKAKPWRKKSKKRAEHYENSVSERED